MFCSVYQLHHFHSVSLGCSNSFHCDFSGEHQLASGTRGRSESKVPPRSHITSSCVVQSQCVNECVCVQCVWTHPGAQQFSVTQNESLRADKPRRRRRSGHHLHAYRNQVSRCDGTCCKSDLPVCTRRTCGSFHLSSFSQKQMFTYKLCL